MERKAAGYRCFSWAQGGGGSHPPFKRIEFLLLVFVRCRKPDSIPRWDRLGGHQLSDGFKNNPKLFVVFLFHSVKALEQVAVGSQERSNFDEDPHDGDVHLCCPRACKDARAWPRLPE